MIVTQPGTNQRWVIGYELAPIIGHTAERKNTWYFPKADDYKGLIYRHTHNLYVYRHPDGRLFDAWIAL